jgi:hypothetical protein
MNHCKTEIAFGDFLNGGEAEGKKSPGDFL